MQVIKEMLISMIGEIGATLVILISLAICAIPILIKYAIMKAAVRNGIKEAIEELKEEKILQTDLKEANIRAEVREGMREILREVDYKAMAKIFANELRKPEQ